MRDITVAMQTELPTARAYLLRYAVGRCRRGRAGGDAQPANRRDHPRGVAAQRRAPAWSTASRPSPSSSPAARNWRPAWRSSLYLELMGPPLDGNPQVFDDEYICSGGQLYELMAGHDRFLADLRPIFHGVQAASAAYAARCCAAIPTICVPN